MTMREQSLLGSLIAVRRRYEQGKLDGAAYTRRVLDLKILLAKERVRAMFGA